MLTYHAQLSLDYLQGRPTAEWTPQTLRGIVAHICAVYALSEAACSGVQAEALQAAERRGLVREDDDLTSDI